jgi:hypothetical protein
MEMRTLPRKVTELGTTFQVSPAWIWVTLITAASVGLTLRLIMSCQAW